MQLLENNSRAPGWVAVGADHGSVSSKLLLQINPVRGTILTTTCQFCELAASSRIAQSGLGSGLGSASKRAGQRIFLPLEGKYLLRSNGSAPCTKGFAAVVLSGLRCGITVVLLGVSLLPQ